VSVTIEAPRMNGMKVRVETIALGSRCRHMMRAFDTPRARAAATYSKLRPRRNSARTRPTRLVQPKTMRIASRVQKLGAMKLDMISSR
jgi:hypothetical protein